MKHNNSNQTISKFKNFLAREGVFPQYFQAFCNERGLGQHDKRTTDKFNLFLKECDPKNFVKDAFSKEWAQLVNWDQVAIEWNKLL